MKLVDKGGYAPLIFQDRDRIDKKSIADKDNKKYWLYKSFRKHWLVFLKVR